MDGFLKDLRYVVRGLRRSPGFLIVSVATIALGIGVNSTIFGLVNAVLLRPLPVERPGELVDIYGHSATSDTHDTSSWPDFLDYQAQAGTLSGIFAYTNFFANLSLGTRSELATGEIVSRDYFRVLGVQPALGRDFSDDEFQSPGAGAVAVLSHRFWQTRFAGDPDVVGRTFRMNGVVYTVVGVAPEGFGGMMPAVTAQMWIPLTMVAEVEPLGNNRGSLAAGASRLESRGFHFLWIRGRRAPGVTTAQVQADLQAIAARLAAEYPDTNARERVRVVATDDVLVNPDFDSTLAPAALVLLAAAGLVLVVACANLASMMLARASARRRELAVRVALGAARWRLVRQMLLESLVLALVGGAVAMLLANGLAALVSGLQPPLPVDLGLDIAPDGRVLVFTFVVATATGILFGLLPALRASRPDLVPALKDAGAGDGAARIRWELRDVLVAGQVAVSLTLLVTGTLFVRSLGAAADVELGYDADRTAYLALAMEMNGYDGEEAAAFFEDARRRLEALPGVEGVAMASRIPLSLNNNGFGLFIDGRQSSPDDAPFRMDGARVDEHYGEVLGLELLSGRWIEAADRDTNAAVAVVTRQVAERYWPGEEALGRDVRLSWEGRPHRIVGVVEDHRVNTPGEEPVPYLLLPLPRVGTFGNILVATGSDARPQVPRFEQELRALDPELTFLETGTLRDQAEVRTFPLRAGAWLIGAFGLLAVALAAVGLYGVIGYSVGRRTREIGIRKALGADTGGIVALVVRQGMALVLLGGVAGAGMSALAGRALSGVLFVGPLDPVGFAAAFGILALVAVLAHWVPARRAARVDPMEALRMG